MQLPHIHFEEKDQNQAVVGLWFESVSEVQFHLTQILTMQAQLQESTKYAMICSLKPETDVIDQNWCAFY